MLLSPGGPAAAFKRDFAAAQDRMVAINVKVLQAFLSNAEPNLDFLAALPSIRSFSQLIALQSEFACNQVDTMVRPAAEIGAMIQNLMVSAVDAMRDQVVRQKQTHLTLHDADNQRNQFDA